MNEEWYTVQPRFGNDSGEVIYETHDLESPNKSEPPPKKTSFFQKYKIYIIIIVVIVVLFVIMLIAYHFQKPSRDKFLTETHSTPSEIDVDEMKKLRNIRRQKKHDPQTVEIEETIVIIEPLLSTKKHNDYQSNKIVEIEDNDEDLKRDQLQLEQQRLEHQKQEQQRQEQLEYQHKMQQYYIEQDNQRRMMELQQRRREYEYQQFIQQQQHQQHQQHQQQQQQQDAGTKLKVETDVETPVVPELMPQFQPQVVQVPPEKTETSLEISINPVKENNISNEIKSNAASEDVFTKNTQNISDDLDSLINKT